jgi:HPt (histidine-containing phosphotransfer) domain-containing protein
MNENPNAEAEIQQLLRDLWQRHLPSTRERLDLIDRAAEAASAGKLTDDARDEARSNAHKLSGNLGMFGYAEAGIVAGEIEHLLKAPASSEDANLTTLAGRLRSLLAPHL